MMTFEYLVLGDGKVANNFCHYLDLLQISFSRWSRNKHSLEELTNLSESVSHILILIKDSEIQNYSKLIEFEDKICVHFSGALTIEGAYSAHPLMTFSDELLKLEEYQEIPFILSNLAPEFADLLPGLSNPNFRIKEELKPLYHALCVCGGNFTVLLWHWVLEESAKHLQLPDEVFFPYLKQVVSNLTVDAGKALTGPFARGDLETINLNVESLENSKLKELYLLFKKMYFQNL